MGGKKKAEKKGFVRMFQNRVEARFDITIRATSQRWETAA